MVTLRPVRVADAELLGMSKRDFRRDGQDRDLGRAARFAAVVEDAVVGLFMLHTIRGGTAECGVYVVPERRRQGVATEALRLLVARAAPLQVSFVTTRDNVAAQRLAVRVGLEVSWPA